MASRVWVSPHEEPGGGGNRVRFRVRFRVRVGVRVRVRIRVRVVIKPIPLWVSTEWVVIKPIPLCRYPLARKGILFGGPAMEKSLDTRRR